MKTIVTGGSGFIGGHLVDKLVEFNKNVIVIDDESAEGNDPAHRNPKAVYHKINVLDYEKILPLFADVDYVFHLAAESRIQPTLLNPPKACQVNMVGTCNVLQAAKVHGVKKVMYSSTSSAYGLKNASPLREDMPRDCLNPYSVSKVAAEDLCKMYYTLFGLPTVIFRYFNVYGERQPQKGQYAPVIGVLLRQKAAGEEMTIVGDGSQRRDFTHVSDVVFANLLAAFSGDERMLGEIFNIGTGINHSVLEICDMMGGARTFIPARAGESQVSLADISKAKEILSYTPGVQLVDWIRGNNVKPTL